MSPFEFSKVTTAKNFWPTLSVTRQFLVSPGLPDISLGHSTVESSPACSRMPSWIVASTLSTSSDTSPLNGLEPPDLSADVMAIPTNAQTMISTTFIGVQNLRGVLEGLLVNRSDSVCEVNCPQDEQNLAIGVTDVPH